MLVRDPHMPGGERTKLLDFGIAKVNEQVGGAHVKTKTNALMGTPLYMSPEQCAGAGGVTDKSDVYSLGVMLFEMLAGQPPFSAEGAGQLLGMHMFTQPPRLTSISRSVPKDVSWFASPFSALLHLEPGGLRKVLLERDFLCSQPLRSVAVRCK